MQIAMTVGNCTGAEADLLRRAMGSKRGVEKIERLRTKLYDGMAEHGITGELADSIYARIEAFANFGFAESHAISFALLVYASSWLKLHYPAAFLAAAEKAFALPAADGTLAIGNLEKFREVNLSLQAAAGAGYAGVWEYASAADAAGRPTAWSALRTVSDTTAGGRASGRVTFDPPRDWKPVTVGGSVSLYFVRFRATGSGTPPDDDTRQMFISTSSCGSGPLTK